MDPLFILPPELVKILVTYLLPIDMAKLSIVSVGWMAVVANENLWSNAVVSVPGIDVSGSLQVLLRAPCIGGVILSLLDDDSKVVEKATTCLPKLKVS